MSALLPVSTESNIQKACLQWLNTVPNVYVWRRNVGGAMLPGKGGRMQMIRFGHRGQSDLEGIVNGLHFECEIKKPGGTPRVEQVQWLGIIKARGGIAFWCDSLRACNEQLRAEFEKRGWTWRKEWECY